MMGIAKDGSTDSAIRLLIHVRSCGYGSGESYAAFSHPCCMRRIMARLSVMKAATLGDCFWKYFVDGRNCRTFEVCQDIAHLSNISELCRQRRAQNRE